MRSGNSPLQLPEAAAIARLTPKTHPLDFGCAPIIKLIQALVNHVWRSLFRFATNFIDSGFVKDKYLRGLVGVPGRDDARAARHEVKVRFRRHGPA
jgi:hypothetical protein